MKYYFPIHLDGGNRGCEAIARGSAILLDEPASNLIGYCRDIELDTRLGLAEKLTLVPCRRESWLIDRLLALASKAIPTDVTLAKRQLYPYRSFLRMITKDDTVLFTGGDMLCYDNYDIIFTNNWLHERGVRTMLWGCSMGPENQTKRKLETLFNFSLIYTRESLTYDYFQSLGLKNLCVMPDPAFVLQPQPFELPSFFKENDLVGLNISKYVTGDMTMNSRFGKELINLIGHILKETTFHILLVPHVTWNVGGENQDDRQMAQIIRKHFGNPERLHILDIDNLNYCQIRHAISKCRMFIGARTHAVISAYSECVPAIALGYSIKSRGIAKDLGLDEKLVVNSKDFSEGAVLRSFSYLMKNEDSIRKHLQDTIPEYKQRTYQIREHLKTP